MEIHRRTLLAAPLALAAGPAVSQGFAGGLPRHETLILENPEGTIRNAGWFNIWTVNAGGQYTGLHQLALDTLWYMDPEQGLDGPWDNSLAAEKPQYNSDFTEMTVKLRPGIHWSDGVEFTSADLAYTVDTQMKNLAMRWGALLALNVDSIQTPDPYTAVFRLKRPNSRFHSLFTVRFNGIWMMPKHVFEKQPDPLRFDFNKPVSLGAYVLHSYDPDGKRFTWERREDWQRTTLGRFGQPGPRYVSYVDAGPPDKRVISQLNHDLDVIHDVAPEGMFTIARQSKSSHGWFPQFPYAHPDPTLPAVLFNHQNPLFQDRRVRWALALLIDIKAVAMASYRGAATISAIGIPPTGNHPRDYHEPMQEWLTAFELDTGKRKIKPYDPTIGKQIADLVRPTNEGVPTDPEQITKAFGHGWWKPNPQAAQELLEAAGFRKQGNSWRTPDGKPFTIRLMVEGEARPVMTRAGTMITQNWRQFGIDSRTEVAQGNIIDRRNAGDFEAIVFWSVETYGGHPDLAYFLDSWHSQFVAPPGKPQPPRNYQRWSNPELDALIERIRGIGFEDPQTVDLGREYARLAVREMPTIPLMAYNVFTTMDETYWTGFPTAENPYANPVPNWGNSRYMMVRLKPRQG
ncbi:ABC transporter substrate-binding protein [Roseomonas marmotae]|uniref:ABC transporter substrate-binding protein n=1 Tax=Roseomonas marmotae TaxID=2768161 RepID=A0ABS3KB36_9PROT|nr:ABC transporter substrate-binding protein [Roseomonas marmotae]MBO1074666.1 ABC transporter substrate-binding protein [Roseomonas marmotae]QTI81685.1 ABC transporter substrate-binding protein [Roseomonas marmotae]